MSTHEEVREHCTERVEAGADGTRMICRVCSNSRGNRLLPAKEMMFGLRETFEYLECDACQCLQLAEIPADLSRYYPADYYAFSMNDSSRLRARLNNAIVNRRNEYAILGMGIVGRVLHAVWPEKYLGLPALRRLKLSRSSRILDVGCGAGKALCSLAALGFRQLQGIDPFIRQPIEYDHGVRISKQRFEDFDQDGWDVIMFHHSFEHMPDPAGTLRQAAKLLRPGGVCLIRIPTVPCEAWSRYGVDWVQLDAPRHFFIHSPRSMELLAATAGLSLESRCCDSTDFQFWGSERYRRGIPLQTSPSKPVEEPTFTFTAAERRRFRREADALNRDDRGDQAAYYLRKPS